MLSSHRPDCKAKLADFGLAEKLHSSSKSGYQAGTVGYLAPEIIEGKSYGASSDIWSLGCLIYAMLTVKLPFAHQQMQGRTDDGQSKGPIDYTLPNLDIV
jgi:serine/threonine protein kinase